MPKPDVAGAGAVVVRSIVISRVPSGGVRNQHIAAASPTLAEVPLTGLSFREAKTRSKTILNENLKRRLSTGFRRGHSTRELHNSETQAVRIRSRKVGRDQGMCNHSNIGVRVATILCGCLFTLPTFADDLFGIRGGTARWGNRVSEAVKPDEGDMQDVAYLQKDLIAATAKPYVDIDEDNDTPITLNGIDFKVIRWWFVDDKLRYVTMQTKKTERDKVIAWLDSSAQRLALTDDKEPKAWLTETTAWRFDRNALIPDQLVMTDFAWLQKWSKQRAKEEQANATAIGNIKWSCKKDDGFEPDEKAAFSTDFLKTSRPPVLPDDAKPFRRGNDIGKLGRCDVDCIRYWFVGDSLVAVSVQTKKDQRKELHAFLEEEYDKSGTESARELGQGGAPAYLLFRTKQRACVSYWQSVWVPDQVVFTKEDVFQALLTQAAKKNWVISDQQ